LKPFGFCVHGGIDGFSRRILWLEVASTNNDPYVVGRYFADALTEVGGLPNVVRADRGTENVNIEQIQSVLRSGNNDMRAIMNTSFLYGRSTANQRIESWWSKFGSKGMTTWIEHFQALSYAGIIDTSNPLDIECCRFSYMHLLKDELDEIRILWNTHHIRPSGDHGSPGGKPDILYYMPENSGGIECKQYVHQADVYAIADLLTTQPLPLLPDNTELFEVLLAEGNRTPASNMQEAADNCVYLLDINWMLTCKLSAM
jgi:hypothetical protein